MSDGLAHPTMPQIRAWLDGREPDPEHDRLAGDLDAALKLRASLRERSAVIDAELVAIDRLMIDADDKQLGKLLDQRVRTMAERESLPERVAEAGRRVNAARSAWVSYVLTASAEEERRITAENAEREGEAFALKRELERQENMPVAHRLRTAEWAKKSQRRFDLELELIVPRERIQVIAAMRRSLYPSGMQTAA